MEATRYQRSYDHRLIELVRRTGDVNYATQRGVPRSTAAGWLARPALDVVTLPHLVESEPELRMRVARLEKRAERLRAMLAIAVALLRIFQPDLTRLRVPSGCDKRRLLRALDRARGVFGLRRVLRAIGLSPSRLAAWRRAARGCELDDQSSCPSSSPQRLTAEEVAAIGDMVTSPTYRHVPTGRLAVLAQRLGTVFASASTWYRLVRERGWRRPRLRMHPAAPKVGIRATKPNELWHIDATVIRLLDGTKAYVHAVIDNFSRRILSWCVCDRLDAGSSVRVLVEAGESIDPDLTPKLLADAGTENRNAAVDQLIEAGLLERVLAMVDINFSNSLIEAWWRVLKHNWLFLHPFDSVAARIGDSNAPRPLLLTTRSAPVLEALRSQLARTHPFTHVRGVGRCIRPTKATLFFRQAHSSPTVRHCATSAGSLCYFEPMQPEARVAQRDCADPRADGVAGCGPRRIGDSIRDSCSKPRACP